MSTETEATKRAVRNGVRNYLKPLGYRLLEGSLVQTRGGIMVGVTPWFRSSKQRGLVEVVVDLFAWSDDVANAMDKQTSIGWRVTLVSVSLAELATGQGDLVWDIHAGVPGEAESKIEDIGKHLQAIGLPFLDKIQTNHDIVRLMHNPKYVKFGRGMLNEMIAKYVAKYPDFEP